MDVGAYKDKKSEGGFDYTVSGRYLDQYECRGDDLENRSSPLHLRLEQDL